MNTVSSLQSTASLGVPLRDVASAAASAGSPSAWLQAAGDAEQGTLHVGSAQRAHDLDQLERSFLSALCDNDPQKSGV